MPDCALCGSGLEETAEQYVVSHRPHHLVVSSQDLPHPLIFAPQPVPQPAFVEDLESSYVKKSHYLLLSTHSAPNPVFLCPTRLGSPSHLG